MFRNTKALPPASTERAARAGQTLLTAAMVSGAPAGQATA